MTQDPCREMVETCRRMNARGINQGTAGNLSMRAGDGSLITPTSLLYERMVPDDLVEMGSDGTYRGRHRPSSEWRFHRDILSHRPDVEVVLHCRSLHATTLACHEPDISAFHSMVGVAGSTTIRCARYATFGTQALSGHALEALRDRLACLLGHHGQIALGRTLDAALASAVEVKVLAHMYVQARVFGEPPVLPEEEMRRVIEQMRRMSYGQPPDLDSVNDTRARRHRGVRRPRAAG